AMCRSRFDSRRGGLGRGQRSRAPREGVVRAPGLQSSEKVIERWRLVRGGRIPISCRAFELRRLLNFRPNLSIQSKFSTTAALNPKSGKAEAKEGPKLGRIFSARNEFQEWRSEKKEKVANTLFTATFTIVSVDVSFNSVAVAVAVWTRTVICATC